MSFGTVAASYLSTMPTSGILQQNSGIWTGTTMAVSLPNATSPSSLIALFAVGNIAIDTPAGWTLRESQVNWTGHYLFTCAGGSSSWNITTHEGNILTAKGVWYIAEIGGTYEMSASWNDVDPDDGYETPSMAPGAGPRLLMASLGSILDQPVVRTLEDWTGGFNEVADVCNPLEDYPLQGVAVRTVTADGVASYATSATFAPQQSFGRSAIITSFIV